MVCRQFREHRHLIGTSAEPHDSCKLPTTLKRRFKVFLFFTVFDKSNPAQMSAPPSLLSFLTPSTTLFPPEEYDGFQLRWKNIVFRPAEFKYEALALLSIVGYFCLYLFGKRLNENRAGKW